MPRPTVILGDQLAVLTPLAASIDREAGEQPPGVSPSPSSARAAVIGLDLRDATSLREVKQAAARSHPPRGARCPRLSGPCPHLRDLPRSRRQSAPIASPAPPRVSPPDCMPHSSGRAGSTWTSRSSMPADAGTASGSPTGSPTASASGQGCTPTSRSTGRKSETARSRTSLSTSTHDRHRDHSAVEVRGRSPIRPWSVSATPS